MLSKKLYNKKCLNNTTPDFTKVYSNYFSKIKSQIKSLDRSNLYSRNNESLEDLTQGFFVDLFHKNILAKYDLSRAAGKDSVLTFLRNHLRNYYRLKYNQEMKDKRISNEISKFSLSNIAKNNSNNFITNIRDQENNLNFCYDVKKLSKKFIRSLRGLEKKAWKFFIYDQAPASKVAQELGITGITASRLKRTILLKAQNDLSIYYG